MTSPSFSFMRVAFSHRTDVLDHGFAPSIDVGPWTVADTVFVASNVDHIAAASRPRHMIVSLFVRDPIIRSYFSRIFSSARPR